eukprot:65323_1
MAEEEKKLKHNNDDKHSGAWRLQISSEHRLRSENLAFDIDVWYPILKKFTFETVFLPFKRREAIAIIHYYQTRYIRNAPHSVPLLTPYDIKILNELEHQISNLLSDTSHSFTTHGAFMRLCGRSPKDAEPLDHSLVRQLYDKNLDNLLQGNNPQNIKYKRTANTKLIAIALTQWLKINHAKDAMNQLLTSERVYTDLHDWIKYGEPEQIVFRVWQSELSLDYEFRCYIYNNRMTAISRTIFIDDGSQILSRSEILATETLERAHTNESTKINLPIETKRFGKFVPVFDSGSTLNVMDRTLAYKHYKKYIKKERDFSARTANGNVIINEYLLANLPHKQLLSRRLFFALGYKIVDEEGKAVFAMKSTQEELAWDLYENSFNQMDYPTEEEGKDKLESIQYINEWKKTGLNT